ncbi:acetylcholine receptor subunit beta-like 1, partial [Diaphorina citri]|uniref:Acetylcholine receptor subunit beta-like 1 n=1 Tax=Diaphorina citri TaxID=121845 RepID=A0A1S4EQF0_DIACI
RLVRDLFRGYNKLIRPVHNMTQKVDVRFGLAFVQLINVVLAQKMKKDCADGNYEVRYKSNVLIYPNGEVLWVPPAIYQVRDYYSFIRDILYQSHRNIQSVCFGFLPQFI